MTIKAKKITYNLFRMKPRCSSINICWTSKP